MQVKYSQNRKSILCFYGVHHLLSSSSFFHNAIIILIGADCQAPLAWLYIWLHSRYSRPLFQKPPKSRKEKEPPCCLAGLLCLSQFWGISLPLESHPTYAAPDRDWHNILQTILQGKVREGLRVVERELPGSRSSAVLITSEALAHSSSLKRTNP